MKLSGKLIPVFLLCWGVLGCNNDPLMENQNVMESGSNATVKEISVTLPEIPNDAYTRTEFKMSDAIVTSFWVENDTIGIFPEKGDQVSFPIIEGAGTNTAIFDGGDWGLKASHTYAAYYPFNRTNFFKTNKTIPIDYTGQTQEGNGNASHLVAYDYLASAQVKPNSSGSLNLEMLRLGSLVMLELVVPESETYTSLTLASSEENFITKAELDISGPEPQIIEKETDSTITLSLRDITLEANDTLRAYLMCSPVDLTSGTLSVVLNGGAKYTMELEPKNLEAGKPYKYSGSSFTPLDIIDFADPLVKQICVSQWDTNNDGELSYEEAAAVTEINGIFKNSSIDSFEELQYFINLEAIGNEAFYRSSLKTVVLPENVTLIGERAFNFCSNIKAITIPNKVKSIGVGCFQGCRSLTSVTLSEGLTTIDALAFVGCDLTELRLPDGLSYIGARAFRGCSNLVSINIPSEVTAIEEGTFIDCENLTSIIIPTGVTSIGEEAFSGCTSLQSVIIPNGVSRIVTRAFSGCCSLNSVICQAPEPPELIAIGKTGIFDDTNNCPIYVPAGSVESYKATWSEYQDRIFAIEGSAPEDNIVFADILVKNICLELWDMNHDGFFSHAEAAAVTSLGDAFAGTNIETFEEFQFFTGLKILGYGSNYMYTFNSDYVPGTGEPEHHINAAFEGCTKLDRIVLPESLTAIGSQAFALCSNLTSIELPINLKVIGEEAFAASGLTSQMIPSSVTSIYNGAFDSCLSLLEVIMESIVPPTIYLDNTISTENTLFNDCVDLTIYVPDSALDSYYSADGWSDFTDIIYGY